MRSTHATSSHAPTPSSTRPSPEAGPLDGEGIARLARCAGARVLSADGQDVGSAGGMLVDRVSGAPSWLLVHTAQAGSRCVPVGQLTVAREAVRVACPLSMILASPPVPADGGLLARHEQELCRAYTLPLTRGARQSRWERRRTAALATWHGGTMAWDRRPDRPDRPGGPEGGPLRLLLVAPDGDLRTAILTAVQRHARVVLSGAPAGPEAVEPFDVAVVAGFPDGDGPAIRTRLASACPDARFVLLENAHRPDDARDARTLVLPAATPASTVLEAAEILVKGPAAIPGL